MLSSPRYAEGASSPRDRISPLEVLEKGVVGRSEVFAVCLVNPFVVAVGISVFVIEGFERPCDGNAQFQVVGIVHNDRIFGLLNFGRRKLPCMYEGGDSDYGSIKIVTARSELPPDTVVVQVLLCS